MVTERTGPLRVAVIGAGPSSFYAVEALLDSEDATVEIDMFDRLPTPFGLVRYGVAPDHLRVKSVTRRFAAIARHPRLRFFGGVEYGTHIALEDLKRHYHQILFATGAASDSKLGVPGEDLKNVHAARDFVAWYNGHPDFRSWSFALTQRRVAVIGMGNVALDIARILCLTPAELAATDMPEYARSALAASGVEEVFVVGRRGPAQAAFTPPELRELAKLEGADLILRSEEIELDDISRAALDAGDDRAAKRNVALLEELAEAPPAGKARRLHLRFLASVAAFSANEHDAVGSMALSRNRIAAKETGTVVAEATGEIEDLPVALVFRSVGYRGEPLPGLPFDARWGVLPSDRGRVLDPSDGQRCEGIYAVGWIKRGPSGVIGTNKPDARETATSMLEDARRGLVLDPIAPGSEDAAATVRSRRPRYFTFDDWLVIDELERARGRAAGRPRLKFTSVEEMDAARR